ncbi:MAG: dodecin family protein [Chloroflexota bacterium]
MTGTSTTSVEDAVQNAVKKASETVRNLRWFEVKEVRGAILDDGSLQWQVTVKIGFALE